MSLIIACFIIGTSFALGRLTAGPWVADDEQSAWCDCVDRDLDERGL